MATLDQYIEPLAVGTLVGNVTKNAADAAKSAGYAAFIKSVTGGVPTVEELPGRRVRLMYTDKQIDDIRAWLDDQVKKGFAKDQVSSNVEYNLGPVLSPWAMKYALPAGAGLFLAGMGLAWVLLKVK